MDRGLQERVIGAVVLVAMAVLVVPVFLDGPPQDSAVVSTAVTLPGQGQQQGMMQTVVLNVDRDEPVPSTAPAAEHTKPEAVKIEPQAASTRAEAASPVADKKPAQKETPAATESATGMWAVQLGSFANQQNAERLAADLRKQGYAAFLSQREGESGALHRVRVGPQKDRESAEAVAAQLKKSGHAGQVVTHP